MKNTKTLLASLFIIVMSVTIIFIAMILPFEGVKKMLSYELILLILTLILLSISWRTNRRRPEILQWGDIQAKGKRNRIFLIKEGHSWLKTGIGATISITTVTTLFMVMGMSYMNKNFSPQLLLSNLHWIILLSLLNAFGEEVIYRVIPYEISRNNLKPYPYISGIFFGLAHFWGNPGGPVGVIISGLLGYFLARSVVETRGVFWAMLIHFLQDLVIFGVLFSYGMFL